jgi:hypothetical protein
VDSRELAEAMADILRTESDTESRAVSTKELLVKVREADRERILDRLNSRTNADITRDLALRRAATLALTESRDRRSGLDRRSGRDRRSSRDFPGRRDAPLPAAERRSGRDRRSGRERRSLRTAEAR